MTAFSSRQKYYWNSTTSAVAAVDAGANGMVVTVAAVALWFLMEKNRQKFVKLIDLTYSPVHVLLSRFYLDFILILS